MSERKMHFAVGLLADRKYKTRSWLNPDKKYSEDDVKHAACTPLADWISHKTITTDQNLVTCKSCLRSMETRGVRTSNFDAEMTARKEQEKIAAKELSDIKAAINKTIGNIPGFKRIDVGKDSILVKADSGFTGDLSEVLSGFTVDIKIKRVEYGFGKL